MKNLLVPILFVFSLNVLAQYPIPYTASTFTDTYTPLVEWFPLNVDPMWDVPIVPLNLQFEFPCYGDTADLIRLSDLGGAIEIFMEDGSFHLISATNADFNDVLNVLPAGSEGSTHRYFTVGTSPNLIYKLEYNNVGFDWEMGQTGGAASVADVQIWLYENGDIEIRYGPSTVVDLADVCFWGTSSAGLSSYWNFEEFTANFLWANGSSSSPDFVEFENVEYDSLQISNVFNGLDQWPSEGQVYHFGYDLAPTIDISELNKKDFAIYPNPTTEYINIRLKDSEERTFYMFNMQGQLVKSFNSIGFSRISIQELNPGSYSLTTNRGERVNIVITD